MDLMIGPQRSELLKVTDPLRAGEDAGRGSDPSSSFKSKLKKTVLVDFKKKKKNYTNTIFQSNCAKAGLFLSRDICRTTAVTVTALVNHQLCHQSHSVFVENIFSSLCHDTLMGKVQVHETPPADQ